MNNELLIDYSFITSFNEGSEYAFVTIYNKYYPLLVRRAMQRTIGMETAEDLVQDIFTSLYLKRNINSNIEGFLFTALERKIYSYWRHEIVHNRYMEIMQRIASAPEKDASSNIEFKELKENIEQQIEQLPPQCQKIFRMKREGMLTNKEIAERLGISIKTVEAQMSKALHRLHTHFDYEKMIFLLAVLDMARLVQ